MHVSSFETSVSCPFLGQSPRKSTFPRAATAQPQTCCFKAQGLVAHYGMCWTFPMRKCSYSQGEGGIVPLLVMISLLVQES